MIGRQCRTDHTAPKQSDQGLHYLPTLSTLFAYKDKMSKYLGICTEGSLIIIFILVVSTFCFLSFLFFYVNTGEQVFLPDM